MSTNPLIQQIQNISLQNKYTKWYCQIVERAQQRAATRKSASSILGYVELHHIIPDSFFICRKRKGPAGWIDGNPDDKKNYAYLTAREHFLCHWLLSKMSSKNTKYFIIANMALMAMRMQDGKQGRYNTEITGRVYEKLKIENARLMSIMNTGRKMGPMSDEQKSAISLTKTGVKLGPASAERKQNISNAKKGVALGPMSQDRKDHLSLVTSGVCKSEEHRAALRKPKSAKHILNMSKPKSEEHKTNMRKSRPLTQCPHCKKIGATNLLKRYHFDNCKDK